MSDKVVYVIAHHELTVRNNPGLAGGTAVNQKYEYVSSTADAYKIGVATDAESRLATLQSGTPNELRLVTTIDCDDASEVENILHSLFSHRRIQGEWFNLLLKDVSSLKGLDYIDSDNISELRARRHRHEWDHDKGLYVQLVELRGGSE